MAMEWQLFAVRQGQGETAHGIAVVLEQGAREPVLAISLSF
jgi:hypothetical protein